MHDSEPFGLGTSSGGSRLQSSPTREESEPMPYDSPLPTGHTVGSVEGSEQHTELMELYTKLVKQVQALEKDLTQTKKQHATELNGLRVEIQTLKEEVQGLKKQRSAKLVISSSSTPHDDDSVASDDDMGDSSKQRRKTDATFEGRKLDFDMDFDDQDDEQGKNDEAVEPLEEAVDTADVEFERKRQEKGKVHVFEESTEQPRKISKSEQAQIDMDYELARKSEEEDVARFMELQRLQKQMEPKENIVPIPDTEEGAYEYTNEEIEQMIVSDPVIKKKAIELVADESLTTEQRSAQLADFINMKNNCCNQETHFGGRG